jgi:hypothetical protein
MIRRQMVQMRELPLTAEIQNSLARQLKRGVDGLFPTINKCQRQEEC